MVEENLLHPFYKELFDLIGEENMLLFYFNYNGLNCTFPKKLYSGKKVREKIRDIGFMDQKNKQNLARKYGYSQRQIDRFLKK